MCVCLAAPGQTQEHGQHGGAAGALWGRGPGLWRSAGGLYAAVPVSAAAFQRHEGASDATQAADQGNDAWLFICTVHAWTSMKQVCSIGDPFWRISSHNHLIHKSRKEFGPKSCSDPIFATSLLTFYQVYSCFWCSTGKYTLHTHRWPVDLKCRSGHCIAQWVEQPPPYAYTIILAAAARLDSNSGLKYAFRKELTLCVVLVTFNSGQIEWVFCVDSGSLTLLLLSTTCRSPVVTQVPCWTSTHGSMHFYIYLQAPLIKHNGLVHTGNSHVS